MIGRLVVMIVLGCLAGMACAGGMEIRDAEVEELVSAGTELYAIGNHQDAIGAFERAVEIGARDPDLHYNLGAAYMTSGNAPQAVLNFRRSLALRPSDDGAASGLESARAVLTGVQPPNTPILERVSTSVVKTVPASLLAAAAVLLALLVVAAWALLRSGYARALRVAAASAAAVFALAAAFAAVIVAADASGQADDAVLTEGARVFSGPGPDYVEMLSAPAGSEVVMVEKRGEWIRLALPPGPHGEDFQGWVMTASIDRIVQR